MLQKQECEHWTWSLSITKHQTNKLHGAESLLRHQSFSYLRIPNILLNPNVHYFVHKSPPQVPTLNQMNLFHSGFTTKTLYAFFFSPCMLHARSLSSYSRWCVLKRMAGRGRKCLWDGDRSICSTLHHQSRGIMRVIEIEARMESIRKAHRILAWQPKGKQQRGSPRLRWGIILK
jgi:hypothetical protein